MKGSVVFIDDQEDVRSTYKTKLDRIFKGHAEIITLAPAHTLDEMSSILMGINDKIMFVVDEDLTYTGEASYNGTELIECIRMQDRNIPIYILTSDTSLVDKNSGDVEFVIDKAEWSQNKENYAQRFMRHIYTYNEIRSNQVIRFDELLCKSLVEPLTEKEKEEFQFLNRVRSRNLSDEGVISDKDLEELNSVSAKLHVIQEKLKGILDE